MRVAFDFYLGETPVFLEVAQILRERHGWYVCGQSGGQRFKAALQKASIPHHDFVAFLEAGWKFWDPSVQSRQKLESVYGKYLWPGLWGAILSDRFFGREGFDTGWRLLEGHLAYWEDFLEKEKPDIVVGPGVAILSHLACHAVCRKNNIQFINFVLTRLPNGRFVGCSNLDDRWESVMNHFEKLKTLEPTSLELERAYKFISDFRQDQMRPSYMDFRIQNSSISIWKLRELGKRIVSQRLFGRHKWDHLPASPWSSIAEGFWRLAKSKITKLLNPFEMPVAREPFFYYPLHLEPESSTLILAPFNVDQLAWIEILAKALPAGHRLYVKEHPSAVGRRDRGFYKRIRKLAPVRLISPWVSSHELIQNADVTVTMTGTAGWEAILYGRPVVVLGHVFYRWAGLAKTIENLDDLPSVLRNAIGESAPEPHRVAAFVEAIFRGSHEGTIAIPWHHPPTLSPENIRMVAEGIRRELEVRLTRKEVLP